MAPLNSEIRWDKYENEPIIIYDDVVPTLNELLYVSNVYYIPTQYPGKVRYKCKYFATDVRRMMIVISNHTPDHYYWSDEKMSASDVEVRQEQFNTRFNVFNM